MARRFGVKLSVDFRMMIWKWSYHFLTVAHWLSEPPEHSQGLFGTLIGLTGGWLIRTNSNGNIVDGKIFGGNITETAVDAVRNINGNITMVMTASSPVLNGAAQ